MTYLTLKYNLKRFGYYPKGYTFAVGTKKYHEQRYK
nr:MAG TPA: hypothetical protein [Caudoviricetes sp.]